MDIPDRVANAGGARRLALANLLLVAAVLLHGVDHARQDRGLQALSTEVVVGGGVIGLLAATSLAFALRDDPRAPVVSAAVGAWIALAVTSSHFAPHWSAFSDPYAGLGLGAVSWAAALLEVAAALVVAAVGVRALRRRDDHVAAGSL